MPPSYTYINYEQNIHQLATKRSVPSTLTTFATIIPLAQKCPEGQQTWVLSNKWGHLTPESRPVSWEMQALYGFKDHFPHLKLHLKANKESVMSLEH